MVNTPGTSQACLQSGSHCLDRSCDCSLAHWARIFQKCSFSPASSLSASWVCPSPLHPGLPPPPRPGRKRPFQSQQSQSPLQKFLGLPAGLCANDILKQSVNEDYASEKIQEKKQNEIAKNVCFLVVFYGKHLRICIS